LKKVGAARYRWRGPRAPTAVQTSYEPRFIRCRADITYIPAFQRDPHSAPACELQGRRGMGVVGKYEIGDARDDLGTKARAVEHTVVPDCRLQPMHLAIAWNIDAQGMRR